MKKMERIIAGIVALSMVFLLPSCSKKEEQKDYISLEKLLELKDDDTTIDEYIELKAIELTENGTQEVYNFADSVFQLESYLEIIDKLSKIEFSTKAPPAEVLGRNYYDLTVYETEYLIDMFNSETISEEEKLEIETELKLQDLGYKRWVSSNGLKISQELLKNAIVASICYDTDLTTKQYDYCIMSPKNYIQKEKELGTISIYDPYKEEIIATYTIEKSDDTISEALELLYEINSIINKQNAFYKIEDTCKETLDYAKLLTVSNVKIGRDKITSTDKSSDEDKVLRITRYNK